MMRKKINYLIKFSSLILMMSLIGFYGCKAKQEAPVGEITQQGHKIEAVTLQCPEDGIVGPKGNAVNISKAPDLFAYSTGGRGGPFSNAVDAQGDNFVLNSGHQVQVYDNGIPVGDPFKSKSGQVLALKLLSGGTQVAIGTMGNLQVCNVNLGSGEFSDCKIYDAAGGFSSITELDGALYGTTIGGDVIRISLNDIANQSGCGVAFYAAADHYKELTKSPFRAFRIAAANGNIYWLTRTNRGSTAFTLNSFLASLMDWFDPSMERFIYRETKLYKFNPANVTVTEVTIPYSDQYRYFMDDMTAGPEGRLFVSFWAPREQDIIELNNCTNFTNPAAPCLNGTNTFFTVGAYMLNTISGMIQVPPEGEVQVHEVDPLLAPLTKSCKAIDLSTSSCFRIPSLGFYYLNRMAASGDAVTMRGLFGYFVWRKGAIPEHYFNPANVTFVLPFDLSADGETAIVAMRNEGIVLGPGGSNLEIATITGVNPMSISTNRSMQTEMGVIYAAGRDRIYTRVPPWVPGAAGNKFFGESLIGGNDVVYWPPDPGASRWAVPFVFPRIDDASKDGIVTWYKEWVVGGWIGSINFYNPELINPVYTITFPGPIQNRITLPAINPVYVFEDGTFFYVFNSIAPPPAIFTLSVRQLNTWPPTTYAIPAGIQGSAANLDNNVAAILAGEKLAVGYRAYLAIMQGDGPNPKTLLGVNVVSFVDSNPPDVQMIPITDMKGATGKDGKVYAINGSGDLLIYNLAAADPTIPEDTVDNFVAMDPGATTQILYASPIIAGGKILATVGLLTTMPTLEFKFVTVWKDLADEGPSTMSDIHVYESLLQFGNGDKVTGAGPMGRTDIFDFSLPAQ